jgi:hypothetical protein
MHIGSDSASYSECALISLKILADFDSTKRRFESSRPSQHLINEIRYLLNRLFSILNAVEEFLQRTCSVPASPALADLGARHWVYARLD